MTLQWMCDARGCGECLDAAVGAIYPPESWMTTALGDFCCDACLDAAVQAVQVWEENRPTQRDPADAATSPGMAR